MMSAIIKFNLAQNTLYQKLVIIIIFLSLSNLFIDWLLYHPSHIIHSVLIIAIIIIINVVEFCYIIILCLKCNLVHVCALCSKLQATSVSKITDNNNDFIIKSGNGAHM